ncbi:MAG TPA: autotransporter-associated beta strand repeat-containing protein [Candidatus Acidoferrum sp.]|nr:autotransporter-associated beta strand repeat-containing protein [Candidatus Acidoferrum sp.]
MKRTLGLQIIVALALALAPLVARADTPVNGTIFSDDFTAGSTVNSLTPVKPTTNSTSYEVMTRQLWDPAPSIAPNDLRGGQGTSSAGILEFEALFATNAVTLVGPGDYIQLVVTWTNSGILTIGNSFFGFGLFNSSQVLPYPGGMNATLNTDSNYVGNGWAQGWAGYWGQVSYNAGSSRISVRQPQVGSDNRNQDLVTAGSGNTSYANPARTDLPQSTQSSTLVLNNGAVYTDVITVRWYGTNSLTVTNYIYSGPDTNGTQLTQYGGIATNANFVTAGFDAMGIGFYEKTTTTVTNIMDISSIQVIGKGTMVTGPPEISSQPVSVTVATNGACAFFVSGSGVSLNYQWRRNGTNLLNGGNISGATTPMLVISSAGPADALSGANGYYAVVSNPGGSTYSVTNSLSLIPATNLLWNGSTGNNNWDIASSTDWLDTNGNPSVFNYGDPVTLGDGPGLRTLNLTGQFLSAASVTVTASSTYNLNGAGSFAGPGALNYIGSGQLTINNVNTYSGGTIISNSGALLYLQNQNALGSGPVTLALGSPSSPSMELATVGSAAVGISGNIIVANDFTIQFDGNGNFTGVFFGNLSGTAGKTLTLMPQYDGTTNRFRVYGTNTVMNANINIVGTATSQANYYGSCLAPYNSTGSQTYNGIISGYGGLIQRDSGTTILNGQNTYAGGTWPSTGVIAFGVDTVTNGSGTVISGPIGTGPLYLAPEIPNLTGSGQVIAAGGPRTIATPIVYPSATNNQTLIIGGNNALTFTAPIALNGIDGIGSLSNRIYQVTNTALTTFSGVISDGGGAFGLTKSGNGILALTAAETYTGPTLVSNGTLQVNGSLDPASAVTVSSNGVIAGTGTINGPVTIAPYGALSPGASIGTLTINNNLTLNGNLLIEINKSLAPSQSNDVTSVSGTIASSGAGTLTVSNLGPTVVTGDKFTLFNKAVPGGGTMAIIGGKFIWNNNLAVDGSISVAGPIKPIITTNYLRGTNLVFGGTGGAATITYNVLSSTNVAAPLSSWKPIFTNTFNTSGGFLVTNPIVPSVPQRYYLLNVP